MKTPIPKNGFRPPAMEGPQLQPGQTAYGTELVTIIRPQKGTVSLKSTQYVEAGNGRPHCRRLDDGSLEELAPDAKLVFVDKPPEQSAKYVDVIVCICLTRIKRSALSVPNDIMGQKAPVAVLYSMPLSQFIDNCNAAEEGHGVSLIDWDAYDTANE